MTRETSKINIHVLPLSTFGRQKQKIKDRDISTGKWIYSIIHVRIIKRAGKQSGRICLILSLNFFGQHSTSPQTKEIVHFILFIIEKWKQKKKTYFITSNMHIILNGQSIHWITREMYLFPLTPWCFLDIQRLWDTVCAAKSSVLGPIKNVCGIQRITKTSEKLNWLLRIKHMSNFSALQPL